VGQADPVSEPAGRAELLAELEAERDARHELLDRHPKMLVEDVEGQCHRYAAASQLRVPPSSLPRVPHGSKNGLNRFERWRDAMRGIGYQLVDLDLSQIPPTDGQPWIAVIATGFHTHALGVIGLTALDGSEYCQSIHPASVLSAFRFRAAV
jgi:hypothetical protein